MEPDQLENLYQFDKNGDLQKDIRALREFGPAPAVALPGGVRARAVVHPELLKVIARHKLVSKDAGLHWPTYYNKQLPEDWELLPWVAGKHAFSTEYDNHTRLRDPLNKALHPRQVQVMTPRIEQIVAAALDRAAAAGTDLVGLPCVVDLRETLTLAVPIAVISELLGIPDHLAPAFQRCADTLFDTTVSREQMRANQGELQQTLEALINHRTAHPGDDLTSVLLSEEDGRDLTPVERMATIRLILVAAIETVGNLMGSAIKALLTHPEALAAVRAGEATWDDVIEETLRYEGPAGGVPLRFPVEDIAITIDTDNGSETILFAAGEPILPIWAAAGRDHRTNPEADQFNLTRDKPQHLAFGHGPHYCAGAHLAVAQTEIVLRATFDRFPDLALAVDATTIGTTPGFIANGPAELPVHLIQAHTAKGTENGRAPKRRGKGAARSAPPGAAR